MKHFPKKSILKKQKALQLQQASWESTLFSLGSYWLHKFNNLLTSYGLLSDLWGQKVLEPEEKEIAGYLKSSYEHAYAILRYLTYLYQKNSGERACFSAYKMLREACDFLKLLFPSTISLQLIGEKELFICEKERDLIQKILDVILLFKNHFVTHSGTIQIEFCQHREMPLSKDQITQNGVDLCFLVTKSIEEQASQMSLKGESLEALRKLFKLKNLGGRLRAVQAKEENLIQVEWNLFIPIKTCNQDRELRK